MYTLVSKTEQITNRIPISRQHWQDGEAELLTLQTMHVDVDDVRQRVVRWLRYELWRDGRLIDTQLQKSGMLLLTVQEFRQLLRELGFADITIYGDCDEHAELDSGATLWTFEAIREWEANSRSSGAYRRRQACPA